MTKVILINGPPRSGKDTVANLMSDYWIRTANDYTLHKYKFADLLHLFWQEIFYAFRTDKDTDRYVDGDLKSTMHEDIGVSYRNGMIALSEDFVKPMLGKNFFGRLTANKILRDAEESHYPLVAVISDSGFVEEAISIVETFGAENVLLVHLFRDKCNFTGDSRSYINLDAFGVQTIEIENQSFKQLEVDTIKALEDFVAK